MKYLYKLFYENDRSEYLKIYNDRISSDFVEGLNLFIKPMDQPDTFELYYVPTNNIIEKVAEIYRNSSKLNFIFNDLPNVAKEQFILDCIVEELFNTNELEGVKSTRDEIARSIKNVKLNKKYKQRFNSMVKSYFNLINGSQKLPTSIIDVRKIYDEITEGEIEEGELPDGDIFRKDHTYILKKSGTGKVIHRGLYPEERIKSELDRLLFFMNNSKKVPHVLRVAIGHYFFGYIHPFYDGNGRTSRFISSLYLSETLGEIPALSLSRGCNKYKNKYLKAFEYTNSIANKGEMNYFIDIFLDIILNTLKEMISELTEKVHLIKIAYDKLSNDKRFKNEKYFNFMFILAQNHFFNYSDGLTTKELANIMKVSQTTVRKIANKLINQSLVKQEGVRPAFFTINPEYFEEK